MKTRRIVMRTGLPSLIGLAMLGVAGGASGQEQQQGEQGQRQEDVRVAVAPSQAQPAGAPMLNEVRVIRVKTDRIAEFEDLLKELSTALSQRGEEGFSAWQVMFGDQATYHIVSQLPSFASIPQMQANPPMEPQRWASWLSRMQATIDSQTLSVAEMHPELSIIPQEQPQQQQQSQQQQQPEQQQPQPQQQQPQPQQQQQQAGATQPELLLLIRQTLLPGKRESFMGWLRDEMLPALRKTDALGLISSEMAFGTGGLEWVFAVPIRGWAELDRPMPLYTTMGEAAARELLDRGESMVQHSETLVLQARSDLSTPGALPGQEAQQTGQ